MKNPALNDIQRALIHSLMFEEGIVPMENPTMDVRRALADTPADEARAAKRKFRKLWRKAMKAAMAAMRGAPEASKSSVRSRFIVDSQRPTRAQKLKRKEVVHADIMKRKVAPLEKAFRTFKTNETKESEETNVTK